jgi:hypothetical protein
MPREPNTDENVDSKFEPSKDDSDARKPGDYYYDDAHGYENYDPEKDLDEEDSDD